MKSAIKKSHNLHVPLPDGTYQALKEVAQATRRPATRVAREAIEFWVTHQKKRSLHQEISAYAIDMAGSEEDLDPWLERAAVEYLRASEPSEVAPQKKRRK